MINRLCLICNKSFKVKPSIVRKGFGNYCSIICKGKSYIGNGNPKWKGGRVIERNRGYVLIYNPTHPFHDKDGYVREHRLVMEGMVGRYLVPKEVVHHINGDKSDNTKENLQLFKNHSDHFIHEIKNGNI